jgi:RNA polymerase sigma factor (sigma-70 family)
MKEKFVGNDRITDLGFTVKLTESTILKIPVGQNFQDLEKSIEEAIETNSLQVQTTILFRKLTKREQEIFWLLFHVKSNKQIAQKLNISSNTARTHRNRIYKKLQLSSTVQLIDFGNSL